MDKLTASKGIKALAKSLTAAEKPVIEISGKNGDDEKQIEIKWSDSINTLVNSVKGKGYLMFLTDTLDHEARRIKSFLEQLDAYKEEVMKELKTIDEVKSADLFCPSSREDYEIKGTNLYLSKLIVVSVGKDKKEIFDRLKNKFSSKFNVVLK